MKLSFVCRCGLKAKHVAYDPGVMPAYIRCDKCGDTVYGSSDINTIYRALIRGFRLKF